MIRIYLQYSYGGFKTFFIEGKERESVNNEVNNENNYDFPLDAYCYFQYGGAKIVYRYLEDGGLDLVVREIPSAHKDGDGRSIPCAIQFIGDESDRKQMDYLATVIANDINSFHDMISPLFSTRGGLHIKGDVLREWIENHNASFSCEGATNQITNIPNIKSGVILFVPLSSNFGKDKTVTDNITKELSLPYEQIKSNNCSISVSELSKVQKKLIIHSSIITKNNQTSSLSESLNPPIIPENVVDEKNAKKENVSSQVDNGAGISSKNNLPEVRNENNLEIEELKQKLKDKIEQFEAIDDELRLIKQKNEMMFEQLTLQRKYLAIIGGAAILLGLYMIYSFFSK